MKKKISTPASQLARFRARVPVLYFCVVAAMALMVAACVMLKDRPGANYGLESFAPMDDGWQAGGGAPFVISEIDRLRGKGESEISLYHRLPKELGSGRSLVFRSKNCSVTVLVGGSEVYRTDLASAPFYNHSPGTRWNVISFTPDDAGKLVELRVHQAYRDGRAKVDNFFYGDRAAIVLSLMEGKLWGGVVSLLILFVAVVFFAAWVALNGRRKARDNSLLWLALFAAAAGMWCLLETNIPQFFTEHLRLMQLLNNMMLVLGGLPLYLYLDSIYGVFRAPGIRLLCGSNLVYLIAATLSQALGLWDFHQTLNGAIVSYGLIVIILLRCLLRSRRDVGRHSGSNDRLIYLVQQVGTLALGLGLLGDLLRYLSADLLDRAFIIRIGLLCFIICFGAGNIIQMMALVKKGAESDWVSRLAYRDGLTELGNRTAYIEQVQRLEREADSDTVALVMFDINDLKRVNDTLGHGVGDELIRTCAELLNAHFGPPWSLYRIGGDEFVALMHSNEAPASYEKGHNDLVQAMYRLNEERDRPYPVMIAQGVAFGRAADGESVARLEQQADRAMYRDKERLKALGICSER